MSENVNFTDNNDLLINKNREAEIGCICMSFKIFRSAFRSLLHIFKVASYSRPYLPDISAVRTGY
jgi:hypothetical protein